MMTKKILYNFFGYLSDKIGISSSDGCASYVTFILQEFMKRDWEVYGPAMDRDMQSVMKYKDLAFEAFSKEKRYEVYKNIEFQPLFETIDDLDILFLEWRWKMRKNQLDKMDPEYTPDLDFQTKLLEKYKDHNLKLIIFDLDHKITLEDEQKIIDMGYKDVTILETALFPKKTLIPRKSVFIPFDFEEMNQFPTLIPNKNKHLVFVGNNYEKDEDFNTKLIPYSNKHPNKVHLVGNWLNDKNKDFREKNPNIVYHPRIGAGEFRDTLKDAVCCPLLAKDSYKENGYMTMRILETLLFGSIPVGFSDFKGIRTFLPDSLVVDMNNREKSMDDIITRLSNIGIITKDEFRKSLIRHLSQYHDVKNFVDIILGVEK